MLAEPIAVTMVVIDALDGLGVRHAIGGSLASAVHGVVRATMDADLVADLHIDDVEPSCPRSSSFNRQPLPSSHARCLHGNTR
jgi:hypothetical protein